MANYVLLERIELNDSVASVTFNNIPQTGYTDLKIVGSTRYSTAISMGGFGITFNGLNTNQSARYLYGAGSGTPGSGSFLLFDSNGASDTANTFSNWEIYIPNYTSSNYKSFSIDDVLEANATYAEAIMNAGLWSSTAAITSIGFARSAATWGQYSTFSLYGLAAVGVTPAIAPKASGGSIIQTDGTYWYHAFLASGTFTPAVGLSCDVLVVAGGGGGGFLGGGGGGGGYRTSSSLSLSTATTVTVGAGGVGATPAPIASTQGGNSVISTVTSTGGGLGSEFDGVVGGNGGSGGGASADSSAPAAVGGTGNTPSTSPSQGNNGGNAFAGGSGVGSGGGGGGAGAVGSTGTSGKGGNGGIGDYTAISGGSTTALGVLSGGNYYFAGGGGGGAWNGSSSSTGGTGGGGGGTATNVAGTAGTPNTGGGGGAGGFSAGNYGNGAKGGSGIVIIRYAMA